MKYNSKYDRYVTKGGLVYRYSKKQDKLVLCKLSADKDGYLRTGVSKPECKTIKVHRLVYETFVCKIPDGMQIDHINTIKDDNRLENLRIVTPKENMANPLTKKHICEAQKGNCNARCKIRSDFSIKFKEHFGITNFDDPKLYQIELLWYRRHNNKCRWEQ